MAPGALVDQAAQHAAILRSKNHDAPKDIFPDGIRTSGQHPPVYDQLKPYSEFPKAVTGATVWKKEDYENNAEKWIHPFTDDEVKELSDTADRFIEQGIPLTAISKVCSWPQPNTKTHLRMTTPTDIHVPRTTSPFPTSAKF